MVCTNFAHASLHPNQRHTCMYSMYTNICGHSCVQMSNDASTCTQVLILCTITCIIVCTYMYNSYLASSPQPASQPVTPDFLVTISVSYRQWYVHVCIPWGYPTPLSLLYPASPRPNSIYTLVLILCELLTILCVHVSTCTMYMYMYM